MNFASLKGTNLYFANGYDGGKRVPNGYDGGKRVPNGYDGGKRVPNGYMTAGNVYIMIVELLKVRSFNKLYIKIDFP